MGLIRQLLRRCATSLATAGCVSAEVSALGVNRSWDLWQIIWPPCYGNLNDLKPQTPTPGTSGICCLIPVLMFGAPRLRSVVALSSRPEASTNEPWGLGV